MKWIFALVGLVVGIALTMIGLVRRSAPPGTYGVIFHRDRPVAVFTTTAYVLPGLWQVVYLPNGIGLYTDVYVLDTTEILVSGVRNGVNANTFREVIALLAKYARKEVLTPEEDNRIMRWYRRIS